MVKRRPGRPPGSKNKSFEQRVKESLEKKSFKKAGRPRGAKNKHGYKRSFRKPAKVSFAKLYMNATGGAAGSGNILELLAILENSIAKGWTDDRVQKYFKDGNDRQADTIENTCHVYMSSKGRLVSADDDVLEKCVMFPGVKLSSAFLDHYIHTPADVMTYGDFVVQSRVRLQRRASDLA